MTHATQITRRLGAFFVASMLPLVANAATVWEWDWETSAVSAANVRNTTDGYWWHGNCFAKSAGDLFNSVELSTKYARIGSKSIRLERQSLIPNSTGHNNCESFVKSETTKHRNEIRYGYGKGVGDLESWEMGDERWFRLSVYIPSDEGNFNAWNAGTYSYKKIFLAQWIGSNPSFTHEMSLMLTGGPKVVAHGYYGTTATEGTEVQQTFGEFNLKKDSWNDIIVRHRRSWQTAAENPTGHGVVQVWANCADWAACTPVVDFSGRAAIRWMSTGWFKAGPYADVSTWDHQHVLYYDAIKMGIRGAESDAQMLAEMADDYTGGGGGGGGGDDGTPVASDLAVNGGSAITSSQDPINFTVSGMNDITNCTMKGPTDSAPLAVKWDYTGAASGKFAGVATTDWPASGSVTCYDEPFVRAPTMDSISYFAGYSGQVVTDTAESGLDHWGYTTAIRLAKASAGSGDAYWTYGSSYSFVPGDELGVDITYACSGSSCNNLTFDIGLSNQSAPYGDWRIRATGTAGALTLTSVNRLWGSSASHVLTNSTMPDGTYRVTIRWVSDITNSFRMRAGWANSGAGSSLTLDLLGWVMRKNWTTRIITAPVTYTVPDTTAPIISNCGLEHSRVIDPDDSSISYSALVSCDVDEIGGTDYMMFTATNTNPDATAVINGTNAIWVQQKPATTDEIIFEGQGFDYQDLYAWVVRCDAAGTPNCSAVAGAAFDDGVGPGQVKKIKFQAGSLLRRGGIPYTGTAYLVAIYEHNPLLVPRQTPIATWSNQSFASGNFSAGALTGGAVNDLQGATDYYLTIIENDGDPYWVIKKQITVE